MTKLPSASMTTSLLMFSMLRSMKTGLEVSKIKTDRKTLFLAKWNLPSPICQEKKCKAIELDENTVAQCSNENNRDSVCKFSCVEGYTISHDEIQCLDGNWSKDQPKCEKIMVESEFSVQPEVQPVVSVQPEIMTENNVSKTAVKSACPELKTGILSLQDSMKYHLEYF